MIKRQLEEERKLQEKQELLTKYLDKIELVRKLKVFDEEMSKIEASEESKEAFKSSLLNEAKIQNDSAVSYYREGRLSFAISHLSEAQQLVGLAAEGCGDVMLQTCVLHNKAVMLSTSSKTRLVIKALEDVNRSHENWIKEDQEWFDTLTELPLSDRERRLVTSMLIRQQQSSGYLFHLALAVSDIGSHSYCCELLQLAIRKLQETLSQYLSKYQPLKGEENKSKAMFTLSVLNKLSSIGLSNYNQRERLLTKIPEMKQQFERQKERHEGNKQLKNWLNNIHAKDAVEIILKAKTCAEFDCLPDFYRQLEHRELISKALQLSVSYYAYAIKLSELTKTSKGAYIREMYLHKSEVCLLQALAVYWVAVPFDSPFIGELEKTLKKLNTSERKDLQPQQRMPKEATETPGQTEEINDHSKLTAEDTEVNALDRPNSAKIPTMKQPEQNGTQSHTNMSVDVVQISQKNEAEKQHSLLPKTNGESDLQLQEKAKAEAQRRTELLSRLAYPKPGVRLTRQPLSTYASIRQRQLLQEKLRNLNK